MAVTTIQIENHDPSDLLDAVTSALWDGETTWLTVDGKRRATIAPAPQLPVTEPGELSYEGEVRYADGTRVSLQCFEGRHEECPDETKEDDGTQDDVTDGPLEGGYNCVCSGCEHGPASERAGAATATTQPGVRIPSAGKPRTTTAGPDSTPLTADYAKPLGLVLDAASRGERISYQPEGGDLIEGDATGPLTADGAEVAMTAPIGPAVTA